MGVETSVRPSFGIHNTVDTTTDDIDALRVAMLRLRSAAG
jgi:hypothetical protein